MSIDVSGVYSPTKVYGQLTMPFINKPVHINAHTPLDEDAGDVVLNRGSFYNNLSSSIVSIEDIRDMATLELNDSLKTDIGIVEAQDFPPKPNVEVFQSSVYTEGSGVVFNALQNGYSASKAINIGNAYKSYRNAMQLGNNPVQTLLSTNFAVG